MHKAICSVGEARLDKAVFKLVPAMLPLTLALAISPRARETSSTEYPIVPARGATYLNDSPNIATLVFAELEAFARTSAKCVLSEAFKPKAVSASVTISDVVARSRPSAAASDIIPSIPLSIDSVSQPAMAMYCKASADSEAENFVFAPISFALSVKDCKSSPVEPLIADTFDIAASKDEPTVAAAVAPAPRVVAIPASVVVIADTPVFASPFNLSIPVLNPLVSIFVSILIEPSYANIPHPLLWSSASNGST